MLKSIFRITALIVVVCLFSACKKDWNELGSQLIAKESWDLKSIDTLAIKASIHKEDSLSSLNTATSFLGSINSPSFGMTDAAIYTEFRMPSSDVEFGESAIADSIILTLTLNDYFGDTTSTLNVNVYEMLEQIITSTTDSLGEDSTITYYSSQEFETNNSILGSLSLSPEPEANSTINIVLNNELAQSFLDADASNFEDNSAFQDFFNGLYIATEQVATLGVLLELDLLDEKSKMTIYYHNTESDSLTYDFQINSNADRMTKWSHDYSSTAIESLIGEDDLETTYIQGGAGLRTYLTIPSLESLKDSNYVIHKAELTLPYFFSGNDSLFNIPNKLGLAAVNNDGKLEVLTEDQNIQGSSYFDGNANVLEKTYTFNIARYVHKVIEEGYTNKLALYVPASVLNPESVLLSNDSTKAISLQLLVSEQ
jgi:hypothetical protein